MMRKIPVSILIDAIVDGKRYKTVARYNKNTRDKALDKISKKKQEIIDELTLLLLKLSFTE